MTGARSILADLERQDRPGRVLMVTPDFFDVEYVINPHMQGNVGTVDKDLARRQWEALAQTYADLGLAVDRLDGVEGLPDMVFSANQTFPGLDPDGGKFVVLSEMAYEYRRSEVAYFEERFRSYGYAVERFDRSGVFEGSGDALWHADIRLIWLGYGFRTDPSATTLLEETFSTPVLGLELVDEDFYHLDTCLSILTDSTAMWVPSAFSPSASERLAETIPNLIEVPLDEARALLACNAHSPDGVHVLIHEGCSETVKLLTAAGFVPIELDTSEFLKAGGSVFCMKQMYW